MNGLILSRPSYQRGTALIFGVFSLLFALAFAGMSIDIGYMMVVRNQLQNAADAAALNGARYLPLTPPNPDFATAKQKAIDAFDASVPRNTANNIALEIDDSQVTTGYWDITGSSPGIHSTQVNDNYLPAVKVTVEMDDSINSKVGTFFSRIVGFDSFGMRATAVAVVAAPGCIDTGVMLPFAINQCAYEKYWNSNTDSPHLVGEDVKYLPGYPYHDDKDQTPLTDEEIELMDPEDKKIIKGPIQTPGKPWVFWLTSAYHADHTPGEECEAGQWTTFSDGSSSATDIRGIIDDYGNSNGEIICSGNGPSASNQTWMVTGVTNSVYDDPSGNQFSLNGCAKLEPGTSVAVKDGSMNSCSYGLIPVVAPEINEEGESEGDIPIGEMANITAFACVRVLSASKGDSSLKPYVEVQMVGKNDPEYAIYCDAPNSGGVGTFYGANAPPSLVNYFGNNY